MNLQSIQSKIQVHEQMSVELKRLQNMKKCNVLSKDEKAYIKAEISKLKKSLNHDDAFEYSAEEIQNAQDVQILLRDVLPKATIVVLVGEFGSGKTTLAKYFTNQLLMNTMTHVYYIDGDNDKSKLKEYGIHNLLASNLGRLRYFGKSSMDNLSDLAEDLFDDLIAQQATNTKLNYIVIEDNLKNIARKNSKGLIDSNHLYKFEKKFKKVGGTVIILHHTNKKGQFADTQDIMNFCDISFNISFNPNTNVIFLEPHKQSRYKVLPKAFLVDANTRAILHEIDYELAKIPAVELLVIEHVKEVLTYINEINQDSLIKETQKFRNKLLIGEKRFRAILQKYANTHWGTKRSIKNSLIFFTLQSNTAVEVGNHE